jgi:hypothetical protein
MARRRTNAYFEKHDLDDPGQYHTASSGQATLIMPGENTRAHFQVEFAKSLGWRFPDAALRRSSHVSDHCLPHIEMKSTKKRSINHRHEREYPLLE